MDHHIFGDDDGDLLEIVHFDVPRDVGLELLELRIEGPQIACEGFISTARRQVLLRRPDQVFLGNRFVPGAFHGLVSNGRRGDCFDQALYRHVDLGLGGMLLHVPFLHVAFEDQRRMIMVLKAAFPVTRTLFWSVSARRSINRGWTRARSALAPAVLAVALLAVALLALLLLRNPKCRLDVVFRHPGDVLLGEVGRLDHFLLVTDLQQHVARRHVPDRNAQLGFAKRDVHLRACDPSFPEAVHWLMTARHGV
mmetsp:Transcript_32121/g.62787  ORF Transcript_32121/g.62787 Transcript_32121/m.62787 type:complete len:252 (+) Transcript_32121:261-1016(+)